MDDNGIEAGPNAVEDLEKVVDDLEQGKEVVTLSASLQVFANTITPDVIENIKSYSDLKVEGIDDKEGLEKVKSAWQDTQATRLWVDKTEKNIKQNANTLMLCLSISFSYNITEIVMLSSEAS